MLNRSATISRILALAFVLGGLADLCNEIVSIAQSSSATSHKEFRILNGDNALPLEIRLSRSELALEYKEEPVNNDGIFDFNPYGYHKIDPVALVHVPGDSIENSLLPFKAIFLVNRQLLI